MSKKLRVKPCMMPDKIWVQPNEDDEAVGICNSPTKCMIAMCLRRMFEKASYVSVNPNGVTITLSRHYYHYRVPLKALDIILEFDAEKHVDLKEAGIMLKLVEHRPSNYSSDEKTKLRHRLNSQKLRANPDYVRPDSRETLRARMTGARARARAKIHEPA